MKMGCSLSGYEQCRTLADTLRTSAQRKPDKEVFIFYGKDKSQRNPLTARQMYELGGSFASRLRQHGFRKGDVIANTLPNSPERVVTDIGIMLAGCTCMNGQILLADGEDFFSSAKRANCSGVILRHEDDAPSWRLISPFISDVSSGFTSDVSCDRAPTMKKAIMVTREKAGGLNPLMEDLISSKDPIVNCQDICPDDYAYIQVTSGSTGYSKLVPRTHGQLLVITRLVHESFYDLYPFTEDDVLFSDRSLGWIAGFPYQQYCKADTRVLMDAWDPVGANISQDIAALWRMLRREKCSYLFLLPMLANSILNNLDSTTGTKLKMVMTGGQPIPKASLKNYFRFTDSVLIVYGSTETAISNVGVYTENDLDSGRLQDYISGPVVRETHVRIVDEDGKEVPVGETGEIQVKGSVVFSGYLNSPDVVCFTPDGFFSTGDYGYRDSADNFYIKGRKSEIIHHGNLILYPIWLEERIVTHPDLQEACVVPVPDPILFHAICACVKRKDGSDVKEDDLRDFCERLFLESKSSAFCPIPEYYMILGQDFPQTSSGKVDRQKLKKMAAKKFGSQ